jgi:hypothetical protein
VLEQQTSPVEKNKRTTQKTQNQAKAIVWLTPFTGHEFIRECVSRGKNRCWPPHPFMNSQPRKEPCNRLPTLFANGKKARFSRNMR